MIPRAEPDLWGGKMLVRYVLCDAGCRRRRQRTWSSIDVCGSTSAASTSRRRWSSSNVIQTRCSATAASDRSSSTAPRTSSFSIGTGRASRRSSSTTSTAEGCDGRRTCRTTSSSTSCSSTSWSRTWSRSTSGPRATRPRRARESLDSHVDHHVGLTGKTTDTIPLRSVYHASGLLARPSVVTMLSLPRLQTMPPRSVSEHQFVATSTTMPSLTTTRLDLQLSEYCTAIS